MRPHRPDPVPHYDQRIKWDHVQSLKEVVRHLALRLGASRVVRWRRRRRGLLTDYLQADGTAARFRAAYGSHAWVSNNCQGSSSGAGSELEAAASVSSQLPPLLIRLGCRRLVDVGCGDWHWMRHLELPCEYVGLDIVPEVVEMNRRFERPGVSFSVMDATSDSLPSADVVLCREVLFHLSFKDGFEVIANIMRSARWLLATSDTAIWFNSDVPSGDFRRINLERRPYAFPAPCEVIADDGVSPGRVLGLWSTADLPSRSPGASRKAAAARSKRSEMVR